MDRGDIDDAREPGGESAVSPGARDGGTLTAGRNNVTAFPTARNWGHVPCMRWERDLGGLPQEVRQYIRGYVILFDQQATTCTLWVAHAQRVCGRRGDALTGVAR